MKRTRTADVTSYFPKIAHKKAGQSSIPVVPPTEKSDPTTDLPHGTQDISVPQTHLQRSLFSPPRQDETCTLQTNSCDGTEDSQREGLTSYDIISLLCDPGMRKPMSEFHKNDKDMVRMQYIQRGPYQPNENSCQFPRTQFGKKLRRFNPNWYKTYGSWFEYSISKDVVFSLPCYLFKTDVKARGNDAFVNRGFRSWKRTEAYKIHVGGHKSAHNQAVARLNAFKKSSQA